MNEIPSHAEVFAQYVELTAVLGSLNDYYHYAVRDDPGAWQYLTVTRGISEELIDRFALGIAPPASQVQQFLRLNSLPPDALRAAGVLVDMVEDRITFPVFDTDGRIIGFSSRIWRPEDTRSKYYNSLASPTFHKSFTLYGLYQALESIKRDQFTIVVEGNVDVIQMHGAGLGHAVAPCGTALTWEQLELLTHLTSRILFCFDADDAGVRAAAKAKRLCGDLEIPFVDFTLEGAKDPDDFIRQYGAQPIVDTVTGLLNDYEGREKSAG